MVSLAPLTSRALIRLSGEDAPTFLQGLITNDIRKLSADNALYAALLTPQGKLIHDFFLYADGSDILLDCEETARNSLMARFTMYKLKSKVQLAKEDMLQVAACWGDTPSADAPITVADPRLPELGYRMVAPKANFPAPLVEESFYHAHRLALGVPEGSSDMPADKIFPLDVGLDHLHGVDFNKGCYIGQEVTARMHYRGSRRKAVYLLQSAENLPPSGTVIAAGNAQMGEIRASIGRSGIGVLKREELAQAIEHNTPLMSADITINAILPAWWREKQ